MRRNAPSTSEQFFKGVLELSPRKFIARQEAEGAMLQGGSERLPICYQSILGSKLVPMTAAYMATISQRRWGHSVSSKSIFA